MPLKLLPCQSQGCDGVAWTRAGHGYYLSSYPRVGEPYRYVCQRCRKLNTLEVGDFHRQPHAAPAQLEAVGLLDVLAGDLREGGLVTLAQARDLYRAGFETPADYPPAPDPPDAA